MFLDSSMSLHKRNTSHTICELGLPWWHCVFVMEERSWRLSLWFLANQYAVFAWPWSLAADSRTLWAVQSNIGCIAMVALLWLHCYGCIAMMSVKSTFSWSLCSDIHFPLSTSRCSCSIEVYPLWLLVWIQSHSMTSLSQSNSNLCKFLTSRCS